MKKIVSILVLLITSFSYSQISIYIAQGKREAKAIIYKKDKQQISGVVDFPKYSDKKVKIKVNDEHLKIPTIEIDSIQIFEENKKQQYTFVNTKTKVYKSKGTNFKVLDPKWLCLIKRGKVSIYLGGEEFTIKKDTLQILTADIHHYLKKKEEDFPIMVSMSTNKFSVGYNAFFKQYGQYYFSDNPVIVEKIATKEYKYTDLEKVVDYYNSLFITKKKTNSTNKTSTSKTSTSKKK